MSKHTPGPWAVLEFPDEKFVEVRANEGYSIVAHVFFNNGSRDETARLIAAAPTLLDALESVPADADFGCAEDFRAALERWWSSVASPAIAKATGEA